MNFKSAMLNILCALTLNQLNEDVSTASRYQFRHGYLAFASDCSPYAKLGSATSKQKSGTNRTKFCGKQFFITSDVTLLNLTSLYYNFSVPSLLNCHVESVVLTKTPQVFYPADALHHVIIQRKRKISMINHTESCHHNHQYRLSDVSFSPKLLV